MDSDDSDEEDALPFWNLERDAAREAREAEVAKNKALEEFNRANEKLANANAKRRRRPSVMKSAHEESPEDEVLETYLRAKDTKAVAVGRAKRAAAHCLMLCQNSQNTVFTRKITRRGSQCPLLLF